MLTEALVQQLAARRADVIAAVGAAEDVDEGGHGRSGISESIRLVLPNPLILRCCEAASREASRRLGDLWIPPSRPSLRHLRMRELGGTGEIGSARLMRS
jgi:hypothetical protein